MTKFNVGDKVRILDVDKIGFGDVCFRNGDITEVVSFDGAGCPELRRTIGWTEEDDRLYIDFDELDAIELVEESAEDVEQTPVPSLSPELAELLANMSRRIYEVEQAIKPTEQAQGTTQADRIEAVCNEVRDLLIRKNHDYGDSFSKQFAKYGVNSAMIRMDDKMRRLETLLSGEQAQVSESIEDSIADLAGYALLALVELRKSALN